MEKSKMENINCDFGIYYSIQFEKGKLGILDIIRNPIMTVKQFCMMYGRL